MSMKKFNIIKIILVFAVIGIDLLTKEIFLGTEYTIIPFLIATRYAPLNTGGAWSILNDATWLLVVITVVFLAAIVCFDLFYRCKSKTYSVAISFIIGGAIGNFIDRIFLGGVRDFISFPFWQTFPTFNIADSFLCVGVILLFIFVVFFSDKHRFSFKIEKDEAKNAVVKSDEKVVKNTTETQSESNTMQEDQKVNKAQNNPQKTRKTKTEGEK